MRICKTDKYYLVFINILVSSLVLGKSSWSESPEGSSSASLDYDNY